jgi:lipopolysaccharide/colanic/teichoic acid biosynthesis glycosyltransferase
MADLQYERAFASENTISVGTAALASRGYSAVGKRLFDLTLAVVLTPIVAPAMLLLCLFVWASDGRNPLFGHLRVGRGGRKFRCWKIRTMVHDAESRLASLLETDLTAAEEWEACQKLSNDPRIIPLGDVLRRTSLDELPQLWNVLRGDMSLVGPRPVTAPELKRYGTSYGAYCSMRPGITGLWQVSGRNEVAYEDRVALDVEYLHRMSMRLDAKIILQTAGVVLRPTGK